MFPASFIFTPAHLHTREFSGYRIPSLALSFLSSSAFPLLPVPKPVFICSVFCPVGRLHPGWRGNVTDSSHSTLLFFMFSHSFSTHTQMCTTISTPCPYSVLDEWQHQSAIYRSCVWRPIITLELMCALVCVSVLSSVRYDTSWTFQFPVRYFPSSPWTLSEKNT